MRTLELRSVALLLLTACGGGTPSSDAAKAGWSETSTAGGGGERKAGDPSDPVTVRFAQLGKELDKLGNDDAVDPEWLAEGMRQVLEHDKKNPMARFNLAVLTERAGKV